MSTGQVAICKPGSKSAVEAIRDGLAAFEMTPAVSEDIDEARAFAAALIGPDIITPETLAWVHDYTGCALFLAREEGRLTGVWANVLLTEAGVRACFDDAFAALDPDIDHVAPLGQEPVGAYAWGVAASTKESRKRIVAAGGSVYAHELGHLPYFTRPATEAGVRLVIERFGFHAVPGATSGLVWMPPRVAAAGVAA
jgi:hypothetical protein